MTDAGPTAGDRERAEWEHLQLQIETLRRQSEHLRRQSRWEMPQAVAMIVLALAAIIAAGRLTDLVYPPKPQILTVNAVLHFDQPIPVRLEQAPKP